MYQITTKQLQKMETLDEFFDQNEINGILNNPELLKLNPFMVNNAIGLGLLTDKNENIISFIFKISSPFYIGQIEIGKNEINGYTIHFVDRGRTFNEPKFNKIIGRVIKELPTVNISLN